MSATRLLRWLVLSALLFAPFAMIGGGQAMAHVRPAAAGHCADEGRPGEAPAAPVDCMIACAGFLPTQGGPFDSRPPLVGKVEPAALAWNLPGLHPEAATPPPRSS